MPELPTTSKYNRLRVRPTATATTAAAAASTTAATKVAATLGNNKYYLNKQKTKSSAASAESATSVPATLSTASANDITQKPHKFQPASYALRRQFQTRRVTAAPNNSANDESATELPRTQNPLFKRRFTLTSTIGTPTSRTTTASGGNTGLSIETTTNLYGNENADGIEDANDQVAKSSIHTSRFNHIAEQSKAQLGLRDDDITSSTTLATPAAAAAAALGTRRQLIPRPRRPQPTSSTPTPGSTTSSRRQTLQSRRRPHKYIEIYSRPPTKPVIATAKSTVGNKQQSLDYEYFDDGHTSIAPPQRKQKEKQQQQQQVKVIVHGRGIIECLDQGNFPHPLSCRKFISCAKFEETGGIVGWEYTCPKGLSYDAIGGMCTWATAGQTCRD